MLHEGGGISPDERITVAIEGSTGGGTPTPTPTPTPGGTCPPVITESTSQAIVDGNSVACNNGVGTTENHYYRAFNMNTFTAARTTMSRRYPSGLNWRPVEPAQDNR
jgi:hypothetical protein